MLKENRLSKRGAHPLLMTIFLTLFQLITTFTVLLDAKEKYLVEFSIIFGLLIVIEWIYCIISINSNNRFRMEIELIGFFLTGVGLTMLAATKPERFGLQAFCAFAGLILFVSMLFVLNRIKVVEKIRIPLALLSLLLFAVNVVFAKYVSGAKNWLSIGGVSFQPSEFIKIIFIFVGAATLERIQSTKNLSLFLIYAGCCLGALVLMLDFGTACIFFFTFLVIVFIRSGDIRTLISIVAAAIIGIILVIQFKPYVADRFSNYLHIWSDPSGKGYQQTNGLIAIASGGLLGLGLGKGNFKNITAATNDLVFAVLCEEWGILFAFLIACVFVGLVIYTFICSSKTRSSYYAISACAASSLLLFQAALNIFGSTDLLPFTGVTLPFISYGGSSMISCWGLLAFIKAADPRGHVPKLI